MTQLGQKLVNKGKMEGRAEGEAVGRADKLKELIQKKLVKGQSAEMIAEALEENVDIVKALIQEMEDADKERK